MLAVEVSGAGDASTGDAGDAAAAGANGASSEFSSLIETSSTRLCKLIVNYTNYCKTHYDIATPTGKLDVNIHVAQQALAYIFIFCAAIE